MKNIIFIIFYLALILEINGNFLRNLKEENPPEPPSGDEPPQPPSDQPGPSPSGENGYNYTDYKATSTNENLKEGEQIISNNSDESAAYVTENGITFVKADLIKESGNSSNIENSEFYGVNAAILVQGGGLTINGGTITTKATGGNALCVTNDGKATLTKTVIKSIAESSARGLHATYGGEIIGTQLTISSTGGSCATLATDRGEGIVKCTNCELKTEGKGSPLIYSTGEITISETEGTATYSQMVVVEGKNTATVKDLSNLKCHGNGNREGNPDKCGIMLYQSMSGDAEDGISTFNCENSIMEILSESEVYDSAPMFFITNTKADINLANCSFTYGSEIFLTGKGTSEWGESGNNGGEITLTLTNQEITGDLVIDKISTLELKMVNSTFTGKINNGKTASKMSITLDSNSKIILTGDSYYTSLTNSDSKGTNIEKGSFKFEEYTPDTSSQKWIKVSMMLLILLFL
jgi:hypothetical protein